MPNSEQPIDTPSPVKAGPRWSVPAMVASMVASLIIGILWIAVYYVAPDAPVISGLNNWNLLIGFGFIVLGMALAVASVVAALRRT